MPVAAELSGCGKVVRGTWEIKLHFLMLKMPGQNAQSFCCGNCQLSCSLRAHSNSEPKCAPRFPALTYMVYKVRERIFLLLPLKFCHLFWSCAVCKSPEGRRRRALS